MERQPVNLFKKHKPLILFIVSGFLLLTCTACVTSSNDDDIVITDENVAVTEDTGAEMGSIGKNESVYDSGDALTSVSDNAKEQLRWENLKTSSKLSEYLDGIGHPLEYGLITSPATYTWYPDGTETYSDEWANFLFSGPVWSDDSICIGITIHLDDILPDWTGEAIDPEEMLDGGLGNIRWETANGEGMSYYAYEEDGVVCKLPASGDGRRLLPDRSVLIQNKGACVFGEMPYIEPPGDMPLSPSLRTDGKWDVINRYAAKLDMPEDELIAGIASGGEEINALNYNVYRDYDTGAEYSFDAGKCDLIYLTFDRAFPYFGAPIGTDFLKEMNIRISWGVDFASYNYTFEDCSVMVATDGDRIISSESIVIIH